MWHWSKLQKPLENLFSPGLAARFYCISYPIRGWRKVGNVIPRFYMQIDKTIVWDFPKDFALNDIDFWWVYSWANKITDLLREYIDTPSSELLEKEFINEKIKIETAHLKKIPETIIDYHVTELLIGADRRISKDRLIEFAKAKANPRLDFILNKRFGQNANIRIAEEIKFPKIMPLLKAMQYELS